jgi:hypothetical protein
LPQTPVGRWLSRSDLVLWHFSGVSGIAQLQPQLKEHRTNRGPDVIALSR